jgi:fructose-specific phosphotransferase system IIA component
MALVDLIRPEVIKVPLVSTTKPEVIRELAELLRDAGKISDTEQVYDALMKREALGSTGLEQGIAVPHAKTTAVNSLTVALGISPKGVDFQAIDGDLSKLFFLLVAPPDQSGPHIEALADIARITKSQAFCRALASATTPAEVVELFSED